MGGARTATLPLLVIALLLSSVALDRAIGALIADRDLALALLFPPHSEISYRTSEFNYVASTNSLGFRDREFALGRGSDLRIMAIGDSFTYGWGVALERSWPKVLEQNLRQMGVSVEIANLGRPGGTPATYADLAERAIPRLQPGLVLVAVLQGDDLAQSTPGKGGIHALRSLAKRVLHTLYPNLLLVRFAPRRSVVTADSVARQWREQAHEAVTSFTAVERRRFEAIGQAVRDKFLSGDLNPSLLAKAVTEPRYYVRTLDIANPSTQRLVGEMAKQLRRIEGAARRGGAGVIVVSVPNRPYMSADDLEAVTSLGFASDEAMLTSPAPDRAIQQAAARAGLPFVAVTQRFRLRAQDERLYFGLDGHFSLAGHHLYAEFLTPIVAKRLEGLVGETAG